ncbi:MAG: hypothetical protein EOM48_08590 [Bacilli bacterium]|nr:hypothetical protein [Bacilli bacterium]
MRQRSATKLTIWTACRTADVLNDDDKFFFGVAKELYVPAALMDFKFRVLKHKGYRIEAPYINNGNFLKNDIAGCYDEE